MSNPATHSRGDQPTPNIGWETQEVQHYGLSINQQWSANGEDQWIARQFPPGFQGYAVDVGASDGVTRNNTMLLEVLGWTVLCIEPSPHFFPRLEKNRMFTKNVAIDDVPSPAMPFRIHLDNPEAHSGLRPIVDHPIWHPEAGAKWSTVPVVVETLNEMLARSEFPRLDALSIDTEGTELQALKGIDLGKWNPKVIAIEAWDAANPIVDYLESFGYQRVERRQVNDLYVRIK